MQCKSCTMCMYLCNEECNVSHVLLTARGTPVSRYVDHPPGVYIKSCASCFGCTILVLSPPIVALRRRRPSPPSPFAAVALRRRRPSPPSPFAAVALRRRRPSPPSRMTKRTKMEASVGREYFFDVSRVDAYIMRLYVLWETSKISAKTYNK